MVETIGERFWPLVEKTPDCWIWKGGKLPNGYGHFHIGGRQGGFQTTAHRMAYLLVKGFVPEGLDLDHLCRIRICVNPDHLEPTTRLENLRRGEGLIGQELRRNTCRRGHPLIEGNLDVAVFKKYGWRKCRTCKNELQNARKRRLKEVMI